MEPLEILGRSRALWNFESLDLDDDEILAQIVDFGSTEDWRALYRLMAGANAESASLRERIYRILLTVPTGHPYFWLAVLSQLGHPVDWSRPPKCDSMGADI